MRCCAAAAAAQHAPVVLDSGELEHRDHAAALRSAWQVVGRVGVKPGCALQRVLLVFLLEQAAFPPFFPEHSTAAVPLFPLIAFLCRDPTGGHDYAPALPV